MDSSMDNGHGGNLYLESKKYGIGIKDFLDYSANINPLGIPLKLKNRLLNSLEELLNYPDPQCTALRDNIALYLNVAGDSVIIGNGASEIIYLLFEVIKPCKILIPAPTFSEYGRAAECQGIIVESYRLCEENGFKLDVDELMGNIADDIDGIFLCNPNNPTSVLTSKEDLVRLAEFALGKDIFLIIDEAFIELTVNGNENSLKDYIREFPNLFIIRAFTKIFAIPGLRLGYGLGNSDIVRKMWSSKIPWSVNSLACLAGNFLPEAGDYLEKTKDWLRTEIKWFYDELCKFAGLKVFEPQTNFILLNILNNSITVKDLKEFMVLHGVLIRDASNFQFLDQRFFRLAVKDRNANLIVLDLLKQIIS